MYLVVIAFGFFAEGIVTNRLIVSGDAAATAHNIMASPMLWRVGVAADLIVPVVRSHRRGFIICSSGR
ncbi:MAG: DUF4386 family protein [Steroidobacteraceae bacterium]